MFKHIHKLYSNPGTRPTPLEPYTTHEALEFSVNIVWMTLTTILITLTVSAVHQPDFCVTLLESSLASTLTLLFCALSLSSFVTFEKLQKLFPINYILLAIIVISGSVLLSYSCVYIHFLGCLGSWTLIILISTVEIMLAIRTPIWTSEKLSDLLVTSGAFIAIGFVYLFIAFLFGISIFTIIAFAFPFVIGILLIVYYLVQIVKSTEHTLFTVLLVWILQLIISIWVTLLLLNAEGLRYQQSDSSELYENDSDVHGDEREDDQGLFNKDDEYVTLQENDTKGGLHNHQGLARWGEGNPYQVDSVTTTQGSEQDQEKLTSIGTSDGEENEEEKVKDNETEVYESEEPVSEKNKVEEDSEEHHHDGLVSWGSSGESEEDEASVTDQLLDDYPQISDDNSTPEYESELQSVNVTLNKESTESTSSMTTVSTSNQTDSHHHHHHHHHDHNQHENIDDEDNSDTSSDKHHIDHLVDPLLSDLYLGNNHSAVPTQIDNETDVSKIESACRKCIKWQQLHSTLPCILYPLNFNTPDQVNQTKLVYIHVMRKVVAQINNSLNELLLDLEL
ncbi:unnamed protein product [Trichobilharzia szidati]|nr:unnamed protein product [Trichobilharzia szidati]